jgi:hypothetical protein
MMHFSQTTLTRTLSLILFFDFMRQQEKARARAKEKEHHHPKSWIFVQSIWVVMAFPPVALRPATTGTVTMLQLLLVVTVVVSDPANWIVPRATVIVL